MGIMGGIPCHGAYQATHETNKWDKGVEEWGGISVLAKWTLKSVLHTRETWGITISGD